VKREDSLDALIGNNSSDGKVFVDAAASACDYCAGEDLNSLFVALFDFAAYINRVAYFEMRHILPKAFAFNGIKQLCFHSISPWYSRRRIKTGY
jgi:hypothetical protein